MGRSFQAKGQGHVGGEERREGLGAGPERGGESRKDEAGRGWSLWRAQLPPLWIRLEWTVSPKSYAYLAPRTVILFRHRVFADVIS